MGYYINIQSLSKYNYVANQFNNNKFNMVLMYHSHWVFPKKHGFILIILATQTSIRAFIIYKLFFNYALLTVISIVTITTNEIRID